MPLTKKPHVSQLNQHLTCVLCGGYFIDATTIIECLHSFCKSCIVKYLEEGNRFCPVCEVQVHKTKPLLNVRPDKTLQDVVYKLIPGLFQREMRMRRDYYAKHPGEAPKSQEDGGDGEEDRPIYSSDETICLSLEYAEDPEEETEEAKRRYLRCPAAVTVELLKRLIRGKYGLADGHVVDVLYGDAYLCDEYSLVDLAYIYDWRRKGPMRLRYRIYAPPALPALVHNGLEKKKMKEEAEENEGEPLAKKAKVDVVEVKEEAPKEVTVPVQKVTTNGQDKKDRPAPLAPPPVPAVKVPAKTWSPAKVEPPKRPVEGTPASPAKKSLNSSPAPSGKSPKFFKRTPPAASVTESPVQEVAVNLTKPSPPPTTSPVPVSKSTTTMAVANIRPASSARPMEDATAVRLRSLAHPAPPTSLAGGTFAGWLRGGPSGLLPAFPPTSRAPHPHHFMSSFIHGVPPPHFPFMAPPPPPPPRHLSLPHPQEGKKTSADQKLRFSSLSSPAPPSSSSSTPSSSGSGGPICFPTPTFSLNSALHSAVAAYPAAPGGGSPGLSPLLSLGLSRDLVGSFYTSYVSAAAAAAAGIRPFSLGGGFHPSLPPTVTTSPSGKTKSSSTGSSLRPAVPKRSAAPPPPLVPIRTSTPSPPVTTAAPAAAVPSPIRSPPTLLPISESGEVTETGKKKEEVPEEVKDKKEPEAAPLPPAVVESSLPPEAKEESADPPPLLPPPPDSKEEEKERPEEAQAPAVESPQRPPSPPPAPPPEEAPKEVVEEESKPEEPKEEEKEKPVEPPAAVQEKEEAVEPPAPESSAGVPEALNG